jgi:hypothetical protein
MMIDLSTGNVLLSMAVCLQAWMIRELFKLKTKVSIVISHCAHCKHSDIDTDQIKKT